MSDDFYAAWHRGLGTMEHRVTITMKGYGSNPEDGELFLQGFLEHCPECAPVVSQEHETNTIAVTLSINASDQGRAFELAKIAWGAGGTASGLASKPVVRIEIQTVDTVSEINDRQPA